MRAYFFFCCFLLLKVIQGQPYELSPAKGHQYKIIEMDYNEENDVIVTSDRTRKVIAWNRATGREIAKIDLNKRFNWINQLSLAKNFNWCLISSDKEIVIWDYKTDSLIYTLKLGGNAFFLSDNHHVAVQSSNANQILRIDVNTSDTLGFVETKAKLFDGGNSIYSYQNTNGELIIRDLYEDEILDKIPFSDSLSVNKIGLSPNKKTVVIVAYPIGDYSNFNQEIYTYNRHEASIKRWMFNGEEFSDFTFTPNSRYLIYPDASKKHQVNTEVLKVLDVEKGDFHRIIHDSLLPGYSFAEVAALRTAAEGRNIIIASNRNLLIFNHFKQYLVKTFPHSNQIVKDMEVDEADEVIYFANSKGQVVKYDIHSGKKETPTVKNEGIVAIELIKGKGLIAAYQDSSIIFIQKNNLSVILRVPVLNPGIPGGLQVNDDGNKLLYWHWEKDHEDIKYFGIIDLDNYKHLHLFENQVFESLYTLPENMAIAGVLRDSGVAIYDIKSFKLRNFYPAAHLVLDDPQNKRRYIFSPEGFQDKMFDPNKMDTVELSIDTAYKVDVINEVNRTITHSFHIPHYELSRLKAHSGNGKISFTTPPGILAFEFITEPDVSVNINTPPSDISYEIKPFENEYKFSEITHLYTDNNYQYAISSGEITSGTQKSNLLLTIIRKNLITDSVVSEALVFENNYKRLLKIINDTLLLLDASSAEGINSLGILSVNKEALTIRTIANVSLPKFKDIATTHLLGNRLIISGYLNGFMNRSISKTVVINLKEMEVEPEVNFHPGGYRAYGNFYEENK